MEEGCIGLGRNRFYQKIEEAKSLHFINAED
jgi:hypothetical protein